MPDQKMEALLNLALDSTQQEKEKSLELSVGYDSAEALWNVIIKYAGSLEEIKKRGITVVELQSGYAIVTLKQEQLQEIARCSQVEFIEKPKRLYFQVVVGNERSCKPQKRQFGTELSGSGVLVAIVDSGIDYANMEFRNQDGTTRIRNLWDQTVTGKPPAGYRIGTEYTREEIDRALQKKEHVEQQKIVHSIDRSGHGSAVATIAAGSVYGVSPESELLIVKLGNAREGGFPRTTELMQGLDYVIRKAMEYQMPVAVNLSFGNTYGPHDGSSLLERFIDDLSEVWKSVICIGTGNEGAGSGHTAGVVKEEEKMVVEFAVQERERALNLQIWKAYYDVMDVIVVSPSGMQIGPITERIGTQRYFVHTTELLIYYGEPSPYSTSQEIYFDFIPQEDFIEDGIWKMILLPRKIVSGNFAMWLPSEHVLNVGTGFLKPVADGTFTIPSMARRAIGVGAYNAGNGAYAEFSGRGSLGGGMQVKPDLVAPGVEVLVPTRNGSYEKVSGTSFATPFVTGGAALLMEWGIVKGQDPYLYGEKIKAYFQRGARHLPGINRYPNEKTGYGRLCISDSIPKEKKR